MRRATSSLQRPDTRAGRSRLIQSLLLFCLLGFELLVAGGCAARVEGGDGGVGAERAEGLVDTVWFARFTMQEGGLGYVSVTEDGEVLAVEGIGYPGELIEDAGQVRTGAISPALRDRLFRIAADEAVYAARVEGEGELLFYEGVLLRIGSRLRGSVRSADLVPWAGLPEEAREVLGAAVASSGTLPSDVEIRQLISAEEVAPDRAEGIRSDPRGYYRFVTLSRGELEATSVLARALALPGLLVAVSNAGEASRIQAWLEQSNPDRVGSYFFLEAPDGTSYQVHTMQVGSS